MTGRQIEIYIHQGKLPGLPDPGKDSRIDDMDPAKRLLNERSGGPDAVIRAIRSCPVCTFLHPHNSCRSSNKK